MVYPPNTDHTPCWDPPRPGPWLPNRPFSPHPLKRRREEEYPPSATSPANPSPRYLTEARRTEEDPPLRPTPPTRFPFSHPPREEWRDRPPLSRYPAKRKWTERPPSPSPSSPSYFRFHSTQEEMERNPSRHIRNQWRYKANLLREFQNVFGGFPENTSPNSVSDFLTAHCELSGQTHPTLPPPGYPEFARNIAPPWRTSPAPNHKRNPKARRTNTDPPKTARMISTETATNSLPPTLSQPADEDDPKEVTFLEEIVSIRDHPPRKRTQDYTRNPPDLSTPPQSELSWYPDAPGAREPQNQENPVTSCPSHPQ